MWKNIDISKLELEKRKVYKRNVFIEAVQKIWNELDKNIIRMWGFNDKDNININWSDRR